MRILTVRQPWAWAIVHGGKDVENRVRNIAGGYRGPVAIHAGLGVGTDGEFIANTRRVGELGASVPFGLTYGAILGVVDLVDVHEESDCWTAIACLDGTTHEEHCSLWAEDGDVHHLVLANPRPLADPIPYKGALGLRTLDESTAISVWEAIA